MLFHAFFRRGCAVLLLAILPGVVCPDAASAAGTGTGEVVMPRGWRAPIWVMKNTPCPENTGLEYWNTAPTLWRMTYAHCKPEGASAQRPFSVDDADHFINTLGFGYPALGGFKSLYFYENDRRTFRVAAVMEAQSLSVSQAETIAADILRRLILYFETNGRNPREEKLLFSSRVGAMTDEGKVFVYAIFDNATGDIRYKMLPDN